MAELYTIIPKTTYGHCETAIYSRNEINPYIVNVATNHNIWWETMVYLEVATNQGT